MKKFLLFLLSLLFALSIFGLVACGESEQPSETNKTIDGITFSSQTFTYDGEEKSLLIDGLLPSGVVVEYQSNKATNAGIYNAKAKLSGDGYKTLTLTATLTINKATFDTSSVVWDYNNAFTYDGTEHTITLSGLPDGLTVKSYNDNSKTNAGNYIASATFSYDTANYNAPSIPSCNWTINKATITNVELTGDSMVEYDTKPHSLVASGTGIPAGATIVYTYNGIVSNSATEVGEYTVVATIFCPNYNDLILTKTLKITSTEKQLYSVNNNGTIYFQNDLDNGKLYKSTSNGNIVKVSNDIPSNMISDGTNAYYFSSSLFNSSIKQLGNTSLTKLFNFKGNYLASDGTYLYFSVTNSIINSLDVGIYKIAISEAENEEPVPTKICSEKAKFITYYDNYIYYANASAGDRLYRISTSSNNATGNLLWDEKIEYLLCDGGFLYFNSSNTLSAVTLASAVYKYDISSNTAIKLSTDNGKYLTKVGNYLYYVNVDALTSTIFGKGIYKVSTTKTSDSSMPGTKVISTDENGFSSLTSDGTYLYYYKLNDKHFYKYNLNTEAETDLMANFVVEDNTSLNGYAKLAEYNGEIYYSNILDNSCLYKYNIATKQNFKVLEDSVSNVYFHQGYMYYSTYVATNYALWRMSLASQEITKVSTDRCDHLIFDEDVIYYLNVGSAYNNHLCKMNLDGSNSEVLFETTLWVSDLYKEDNFIYCIANAGFLGNNDKIYKFNISTNTADEYDFESTSMFVKNGIIYYYDHNENTLNRYDGNNITILVENVEVNDLFVMNNQLFYSSTKTNVGFYVYDLNSNQTTKLSNNNADGMFVCNNTLYFIQVGITYVNDYPTLTGSNTNDGCLYSLTGTTITKLI